MKPSLQKLREAVRDRLKGWQKRSLPNETRPEFSHAKGARTKTFYIGPKKETPKGEQ